MHDLKLTPKYMSHKQWLLWLWARKYSLPHFLKLVFGNVVCCGFDSQYWVANNHIKERNILKCFLSLLYKLIGTVVPTVSLL